MSDADRLIDGFTALCARLELHGDLEGASADISAMYLSPPRAFCCAHVRNQFFELEELRDESS